jgi:pimeloyl-ACP methyl ester carboxylesterase
MNRMFRAAAILGLVLVAAPAYAQDQFFSSNGVRIRYVDRGKGEAVVLIHGNGGSLQGWIDTGVLPNLERDHRVIALDARGNGQSGKPHDVAAYGREMALDIVRLMDHLQIRRAHIVGYSMGASITGKLLTLNPERFLTAVMGGSTGRFRWNAAEEARIEQEASEKERECISRSQMRRLAPTGQPTPSEEEIQKRSAACMADPNQDRFALAALHRGSKDLAVTPEQAAAIKVPTLGVVGSLDGYLAAFQEFRKLRPDLKLVVIEGASHGGPRGAMARPEFVAAVREFIAAHRGTSR